MDMEVWNLDMALGLDMESLDMEVWNLDMALGLDMGLQEHNRRGICMPSRRRWRRYNAWLV